jgi:hypothetical protein
VLNAIKALPEALDIALLVASDHGMVPVQHIVNLPRILLRHDIEARAVTTGTTAFLYFGHDDNGESATDLEARIDSAARALSQYDEFEILRKEALPVYARLGDGPRVPELILSAKPGYYTADPDLWPWYLRPLGVVGQDFLDSPLFGAGLRAAHGYPPGTPGNDGVLYVWGSGVRAVGDLGAVPMINVHPTVAQLLGIDPGTPVDGRPIDALSSEPPPQP